MELIRNDNELLVKFKDEEKNTYKIGLGSDSLNMSESEAIEKASKLFEEIKAQKSNPSTPDYKILRAKEYPPIEEQLDLIYWDKVNGTNFWEKAISAIKEKYPKN